MHWSIFFLVSAVFIACADLMTKKTLHRVHALEFMGSRSVVMIPLILCMIPFVTWSISAQTLLIILVLGAILTFAILYRIKAVRHLEVSTTAPLMNLTPVFLIAFAATFLQEMPTGKQIAGIILIMGGAYVIQVKSSKHIFEPIQQFFKSKYIQYIFFALVVFAFTATTERFLIRKGAVDPITYLFFVWLFISIIGIALDLYRYGPKDMIYDIKNRAAPFFLIGLFALLASIFYMYGISQEKALIAVAIPIKRFSTLIVTLVGGSMFHEKNLVRKAVGCIIMVMGGLLIIL
jgi:drug/metabolite transporter (DMT)-like permease